MEQAGGLSLTGKNRIMDLIPKSVHQRVPVSVWCLYMCMMCVVYM